RGDCAGHSGQGSLRTRARIKDTLMSTATLPALGPTYDWQGLYARVQNTAHIPATDNETVTPSHWVLRHMFINVAEVYSRIQSSNAAPASVTLYADVVYIPTGYTLTLNGTALVIAARRVEVADHALVHMTAAGDRHPILAVFATELAGTLNAAGG